jgi:hypothetical protein
MGRNFRILPGPARGPFGPSPKFKLNVTLPHLSPNSFYSSPIYLQSALTTVSLIHVSFNAQMPVITERII